MSVDLLYAEVFAILRALLLPPALTVSLFPCDCGLGRVVLSNVQVRGAAEYWRDFADSLWRA